MEVFALSTDMEYRQRVINEYRVQVGDEKVLEMDSGNGCTTT